MIDEGIGALIRRIVRAGTLNQLRSKYLETKAADDAEIARLSKDLNQAQGELVQKRQETGELLRECEHAREEIRRVLIFGNLTRSLTLTQP
jgi:hypothetical protein